jgi:spore coat protein A, manganese oxidase
MITRRDLLKAGALVGAVTVIPGVASRAPLARTFMGGSGHAHTGHAGLLAAAKQQGVMLLDPRAQPKFVNPLPIPPVINATGGGTHSVSIAEFQKNLGLVNAAGQPISTRVWGYNGSYPGPTFVAQKNVTVNVQWTNNLPYAHLLPVDTSIHWAYMGTGRTIGSHGVPVVTHLHGGHTESASDGLPEQWFSKGESATKTYHNTQEAGTVWYHDHALGITRLNVYAGLAGFYLLRDDNENQLINSGQLPSGAYEIGMAIQDRMFTADGQLYYPTMPWTHPGGVIQDSIMPEMFGDFVLVNGMAWPFLNVQPTLYRLRLLNGSDSRFYDLTIPGGVTIYQIGTDLGLLNAPVQLNRIVLAPGERADLLVDFSKARNKTLTMKNGAAEPYPKGAPPPVTVRDIMVFRVGNQTPAPRPIPGNLRPISGPIQPLQPTAPTRQLILFEGVDEYGRLEARLGTLQRAYAYHDPITEFPALNSTEIWEIYNHTPDAHPIHLHLVGFQILDRQKFKATVDPVTGATSNIKLQGKATPPPPHERGWKDTAQMFPGERTRIIARFDRPGRYVWHCHILSHEDHDMMRPYEVV